MRKYPLLVALILLALVVTACATGVPATPTPEPEPPSVPVPATPAAQEAAVASPDYFGTFPVSLPAADGPGRIVTADLAEDGSVQVTSDYQNGQPPIVEPLIGGSGPLHPFIHELVLPVVTSGCGHPHSRVHAPNENIRIPDFINGIKHTARIITRFAEL